MTTPRYPLYAQERERLKLASGRPLAALTLEAVRGGEVGAADVGIHPDTLRAQAEVAERNGFRQVAANLRRAAELAGLPDERLLAIYEALRPGRATRSELDALARELEETHSSPLTAAFVREAARAAL